MVESDAMAWRASVGGALVASIMAGAPSIRNGKLPSKLQAFAARVVLVSNTNDNGPGSLRSALQDANSAPGATIQFAIPRSDPGFANGVWAIAPLSALPSIIAASTQIDGSSQTTFGGNTNLRGPEIEIRGDRIPAPNATSPTPTGVPPLITDGLIFNAANGVLRGVTVNRFSGNGVTISGPGANGVRIEGCFIGTDAAGKAAAGNRNGGVTITKGATNTVIGGSTPTARNVIAGNGRPNSSSFAPGNIVVLSGKCRIQGNRIGTDAGGTIALNGSNISVPNIFASNTLARSSTPIELLVGGVAAGEGNLISGGSAGVDFLRSTDSSAIVQGNRIGTDASGTRAIPNGNGIFVGATGKTSCLIGGPILGARNIISGNRFTNLSIFSDSITAPGRGVVVQNNLIGPNAAGTPISNLNGAGIQVFGSGHVIGAAANDPAPLSKSNQIAGHAIGVNLPGSFSGSPSGIGNVIRGNGIFSNQRQNINLRGERFDLANTFNDPLDADTGPNRRQNYPVLSFARQSTSLVVGGALGSTPGRTFVLDFYRSDRPGVNGQGEGQTWIGTARVTTDR